MRRFIIALALAAATAAAVPGIASAVEAQDTDIEVTGIEIPHKTEADTATLDLEKPAATNHIDLPALPDGYTGRVPLGYPDLSATATGVVSAQGGTSGQYNGITFDQFDSGDIVVVLSPGSTGHAGVFDHGYYTSISSYAVWSANTAPRWGVQREKCIKYRNYDRAYGLWVPTKCRYASAARYYCRAQAGEPYSYFTYKTNQSSWYCSKLAWAAWRWTAGVDLDDDGGMYVWPVDLVEDNQTAIFDYWH